MRRSPGHFPGLLSSQFKTKNYPPRTPIFFAFFIWTISVKFILRPSGKHSYSVHTVICICFSVPLLHRLKIIFLLSLTAL